jgi:hypothetical protein
MPEEREATEAGAMTSATPDQLTAFTASLFEGP